MTEPVVSTSSPLLAGLRGRCPRCGEGHLFTGYLAVAPGCDRCGLDFGFADAGDGPAVFIMMIVGFLTVGLALWLDASFGWSLPAIAAVVVPLVFLLVLGLLRPAKGLLIAAQWHNKAEEGRREDRS